MTSKTKRITMGTLKQNNLLGVQRGISGQDQLHDKLRDGRVTVKDTLSHLLKLFLRN